MGVGAPEAMEVDGAGTAGHAEGGASALPPRPAGEFAAPDQASAPAPAGEPRSEVMPGPGVGRAAEEPPRAAGVPAFAGEAGGSPRASDPDGGAGAGAEAGTEARAEAGTLTAAGAEAGDRAPKGAEGTFVSPELRGRGARLMRKQVEKEFKEARQGRCSSEQGRVPDEDEGELFMKSLTEFIQDMLGSTVGSVGWKVPRLEGEEIDFCKLYRLVAQQGGFLAVSSTHRWKNICYHFEAYEENQMEYGAYRVKGIYEKWLLAYENHYLDLDGCLEEPQKAPRKAIDFVREETAAAQKKSAETMKVAKRMMNQFYPSCGPLVITSLEVDVTREVVASLKATELARRTWALNYLLVLTHGIQTEFAVATKPGLLAALMNVAAALNPEDTLVELPGTNNGSSGGPAMGSAGSSWWWEDPKCGILTSGGSAELAAQHSILAMTIVHNLSLFEGNRIDMAVSQNCMGELLNAGWALVAASPADSFYAEKRVVGDLALAALRNLAQKINISEKRFDKTRPALCKLLSSSLMALMTQDCDSEGIEEGTQGMGLCLRAFDILQHLMSSNKNTLSLTSKFGKVMVRVAQALLSQPSDAVVIQSLQFLQKFILPFSPSELRELVLGQQAIVEHLVLLLCSRHRNIEVEQEVMATVRGIVRGPAEARLFAPHESSLVKLAASRGPHAGVSAQILKLCGQKREVKKKKAAPATKKKNVSNNKKKDNLKKSKADMKTKKKKWKAKKKKPQVVAQKK